MNISHPIGAEISSVNFGFLSTEDVQNISVRQIVNPTVFDNLGHPTKGGLYDLALGPFLGKTRYSLLRPVG
jgi:DNA-directed RNA polymerase I subunit RPA1